MSKVIPSWVKRASEAIKTQQAEESVFYKLPEGETEILVDDAVAFVEITKAFNKKDDARIRYQYAITVEEQQKTLEVGKQLHRLIIKALMQGLNPMTIVRVGIDINTKYGIKGLMKPA